MNIPTHFDVSFEQDSLCPTSDPQLYKAKVRVFYKYSNRNGSYITDDFGQKLAVSAYNKPVVGYYDVQAQDFLGHEGAEKLKAYGFVIPDSLVWCDHLDEDGITRSYATYEVLIWAKYWQEAMKIFAKTQSMELDRDTISGNWNEDGEYVYTSGSIAGLCILGDMKIPCFEGAAFFSTDDESYKDFTQAIKNYFGGSSTMNVKVAGLEHELFDSIWNALNPNFNEEGAYSINFIPCEITEDAVFALSCENAGQVNKYSYSVNEEGAVVIAEEFETNDYKTQTVEIAAKLAEALETYEALKSQYEALTASQETLQAQLAELQNQMATEQEQYATSLAEKDATIQQYSIIIADYDAKEKDAIISKFSACMPADTIQTIIEKKDTMTIAELNTELALEYTKFSMAKEQKQDIRFPQEPPEESALVKLLRNYKK